MGESAAVLENRDCWDCCELWEGPSEVDWLRGRPLCIVDAPLSMLKEEGLNEVYCERERREGGREVEGGEGGREGPLPLPLFPLPFPLFPPSIPLSLSDDTIDESYGVNVVFHEDEEDDPGIGGRGDGGGHGKEGMIAQDDEDIVEDDEDEGMEADYDEVLKTAVSQPLGLQWNPSIVASLKQKPLYKDTSFCPAVV